MMSEQDKLVHLTRMAERLRDALETDISALEHGRPKEMQMLSPELQKMSLVYSREMKSLSPDLAKTVSRDVRRNFVTVTRKVKDLLPLHMRYLTRVRNASEGIIQAVAKDVEKKRNEMRPYVSPTSRYKPPASALVYNAVV